MAHLTKLRNRRLTGTTGEGWTRATLRDDIRSGKAAAEQVECSTGFGRGATLRRWKHGACSAADLFEQGVMPAEIARQARCVASDRLGLARRMASIWPRWACVALDVLGGCRSSTRDQLGQVEGELAKGAEANGYPNDLWTLQRVAEVIERLTGVAYHPAHVWYLLRHELNWSWQRPARRATERNDEAIHQWVKKRWPTEKRARRQNALIVFEDESGVSLLPSVRATWAPRGQTPVLRHRVQLETAVAGRCAGVRAGWQRCASLLPTASWRLQRRNAHRVPERVERHRAASVIRKPFCADRAARVTWPQRVLTVP